MTPTARRLFAGPIAAILCLGVAGGAARAEPLCFEKDIAETASVDVVIGAGPDAEDADAEPAVPIVDLPALLAALRVLEDGWRTPNAVWPDGAVQVVFRERGLMVCQVVYSRTEIYAMDAGLDGFVVRALRPGELYDLNQALSIR
ncbi:MAG: hypothetical protein AAGC56_11875 [Pseudomonadota bacterium]